MAKTQASWDDVRIFLAVHRNRTLAAAAGRLGVDTSTVSRRLAAFEADLDKNYASVCDPRLNYRQSLEMAFRIGRWMSKS